MEGMQILCPKSSKAGHKPGDKVIIFLQRCNLLQKSGTAINGEIKIMSQGTYSTHAETSGRRVENKAKKAGTREKTAQSWNKNDPAENHAGKAQAC